MRPIPSLLMLAAGLALTAGGCVSQTAGACRDADAAMAARTYAGAVPLDDACLAGTTLSPADRADAHHKRGRAHMKVGHPDATLADFAAARRLKPDHLGAHNSAAWTHYLRGQHAKADAMARRARALAPRNVRVVDTHAHILAALGHKRAALKAFLLTCEKLHSKAGITKLQRQLTRIGYDPGPATGVCNRKTKGVLAGCVWHRSTVWK